ncbi:unnamed protein product [Trichobilharzia regenti]|nr:unnamed protein product [Trichobilharzia regenti]
MNGDIIIHLLSLVVNVNLIKSYGHHKVFLMISVN